MGLYGSLGNRGACSDNDSDGGTNSPVNPDAKAGHGMQML